MADCGAEISTLLRDHRSSVVAVLGKVHDHLHESADKDLQAAADEYPLDELAVLKFVLSAQKRKTGDVISNAASSLLSTLDFRKRHRDLLRQAAMTKDLKFYLPGVSGGFLGDYLVNIYYAGKADMNAIAKTLGTHENALNSGIFLTEQIRIQLDKRTRETGRLSKLLAVVDLTGLSISKSCNRMMMGAMGAISKHNDVHSPQVLGKHIVINAPPMVNVFITMIRPFLSKSTWEKLGWCHKGKNDSDITKCPFISSFSKGASSIPREVGGQFVPSNVHLNAIAS